jgi:hypothetical protein
MVIVMVTLYLFIVRDKDFLHSTTSSLVLRSSSRISSVDAAFGYVSQHLTSTYSIFPRTSFAGYSSTHLVSLRRVLFASHQLALFAVACFTSQQLVSRRNSLHHLAASCFTTPYLVSLRSIRLLYEAS